MIDFFRSPELPNLPTFSNDVRLRTLNSVEALSNLHNLGLLNTNPLFSGVWRTTAVPVALPVCHICKSRYRFSLVPGYTDWAASPTR